MSTKELRKLLKENGVCAYTYWGKDKLIDLAKINKLLPEPEPEPEEPETPKKISWQKLKNIRNSPVNVKLLISKREKKKYFHLFIKRLNIWINPHKL